MMNGCGCRSISQQLRGGVEYNPCRRQLGISLPYYYYNYYNNTCVIPNSNSNNKNRVLRFKLFSKIASSSSSYSTSFSIANNSNSDDLVAAAPPLLSDCLRPAENGANSTSEGLSPVAGGIVALGKFDALHIGHRELAIQAANVGVPFLLSFVGMAEILGWEPRAPIVAKCDRKRVLSSWAPLCGNVTPKEFHVEFSKVRSLTPRQFVEKLSEELGVHGVVAGQNYRFGYRASGDATELVRLCKEYGMTACIINSVMDKNQNSRDVGCSNSKEQGQVSSTRVRQALANGDMKYVSELLGRDHRVMLMVRNMKNIFRDDRKRLSAPRSCLLNLPPKEGHYRDCYLLIGDDNEVVPCRVIIDSSDIHLELDVPLAPHINITPQNSEALSINFEAVCYNTSLEMRKTYLNYHTFFIYDEGNENWSSGAQNIGKMWCRATQFTSNDCAANFFVAIALISYPQESFPNV